MQGIYRLRVAFSLQQSPIRYLGMGIARIIEIVPLESNLPSALVGMSVDECSFTIVTSRMRAEH